MLIFSCPVTLNWYAYANDNPLRYVDPDGRSANDAFRYLREHSKTIDALSAKHNLPEGLLESVVWNENKLRGAWSAAKDVAGLGLKGQASLGVAQVQMATAVFLDTNPDPASLKNLSGQEFEALKEEAFSNLSLSKQKAYAGKLLDIETNLDYAARYLALIGEVGGFSQDQPEAWLSAYNISKGHWGEVTDYGEGFLEYENLSWWDRVTYGIVDFFDWFGDGWD